MIAADERVVTIQFSGPLTPTERRLRAVSHCEYALFRVFAAERHRPAQAGAFTVLAAFALVRDDLIKVIALATGTKCLPLDRLPPAGDALHDSHAEVVARRAALRWFMEEIGRARAAAPPNSSRWLAPTAEGKWTLRPDVQVFFYVSMLPCGDASMGQLALQQDPEIMAQVTNVEFPSLDENVASRGRVDFSRLGVLRTKPGRVDSPPTACMSCSDKVALWTVCGIQGALAASLLNPVYIDIIIIGDVPIEFRTSVASDCERAFATRIQRARANIPAAFKIHPPRVIFTDAQFSFSRTTVCSSTSAHESLCWIADTEKKAEVFIDGIRRGINPRQRLKPGTRPLVSKAALFELWAGLITDGKQALTDQPRFKDITYAIAKTMSSEYVMAKAALRGPGQPFAGWKMSNTDGHLEQFTIC
ncbi:adenosine deaminase/editase [Auriculariales sp. MPI-PUGE-AT-0066]|nr:adenosine deaminase/editase [Auriculariales sp. MPI-PUGE-AT-0066]